MSKVVRVRYEKGVLKPLDPLDLEEGEEALIMIKRDVRKILKEVSWRSWEILDEGAVRA